MSDNPEVGNEQPEGAQSTPSSGPPADGQVAISSKDFAELQKTVQSLTGKVGTLLQDQKGTSTAVKEHSKVLAEYRDLIAKGLTPEAAEAAMGQNLEQQSVTAQLAEMRETLNFLAVKAGIAVTNPDIAALVTRLQLDPNSPEVARVLAEGKQGDALRADLAELALQKAGRPAPTAAAAPAAPAGSPPPAPTQAGLLEQYTKEMQAARGNAPLLKQTKEKFRKLGLPVDSVVFH